MFASFTKHFNRPTRRRQFQLPLLFLAPCFSALTALGQEASTSSGYDGLLQIALDLRVLARPTSPDGIPDYTPATMQSSTRRLKSLQSRLTAISPSHWRIEERVDYEIVRAEMNGLDFHMRVLQPWSRDPAFYALVWTDQSDTPVHEGPTSHASIERWTYSFPLNDADRKKLAAELRVIPPLLKQARTNLTGNARDLWVSGIRNVRQQIADLDDLAERTAEAGPEFTKALRDAKEATERFAEWLEEQAPSKSGPSGVGKKNYTWHLRHVLLAPLSWEEEVTLLKRELDRAWSMVALERQHNRNLPELIPAKDQKEYDLRADRSVRKLMAFLNEQEILPVRDYMEPALRKHLGGFQPESSRNFFSKMMHLEPNVLYTHATHWFDLARMEKETHRNPFRKEALPFNIWMHRSEGLATAVEEIFMHAGLYDDNPRVRELVWIMLAQRCARGLASLYAQANEMTLAEAQAFQIEWTPRGMMIGDPGLSAFEQQLYLRQPGYGTCYVTGKYLFDRLLKDRSRQIGDGFRLLDFFKDVYETGLIPVSLIRWQLTGLEDEFFSLQAAN